MCEPDSSPPEAPAPPEGLSRRAFSALSAAAGLALALPAGAAGLTEADARVPTPDGEADAWIVHPAAGRHPGVVLWPDILSLRPAMKDLARGLALAGHAVLVVNPFYRQARAPVVPEGSRMTDPGVRERVFPLMQALTPAGHRADGGAAVDWLDAHPAVDRARPVGTLGYCMGGAMALRTAAARPARVGAAASFHGGGLVTDGPDSPHLLFPGLRARLLIAIAQNDDAKAPTAKDALRAAAAAAPLSAEIEVYPADHGWCAPDSPAHHPEQAARAWGRLLQLFADGLR
jgi:carboxymethylenebutenolidase